MANDFRSLLSTFQTATSTESNSPNNRTSRCTDNSNSNTNKLTLKELIDKMWRVTQIKRSATTANKQVVSSVEKVNHEEQQQQQRHIRLAVCLCIVDKFPHEEIWKHWISDCSAAPSRVSAELFVHAKYPERIKSQWLRSKLISKTFRPNWNDVRIVRAMLRLIEESLSADKNITHILFATESCIPVVPLPALYPKLEVNKSYVSYFGRDKCTRFDDHSVYDVVAQKVPRDAIFKALPGWCTLCRNHAQDILTIPSKYLRGLELWPAFEQCWAPEEVYFPTCLSLLSYLPGKDVLNKSLTYSQWDHKASNHKDRAHPKTWDVQFSKTLVDELKETYDCLFLRKVEQRMNVWKWKQAIGVTQTETPEVRNDEGEKKRKACDGNLEENDGNLEENVNSNEKWRRKCD